MGIFKDYEDIVGGFYPHMKATGLRKLLETGVEIRKKLGNKAFKLDRYLMRILDAIDNVTKDALSEGFEESMQFACLCGRIAKGEDSDDKISFSQNAKNYIDAHKFVYYDSNAVKDMYYCALFDEYVFWATEQFMEHQTLNIREKLDIVEMRHSHNELALLVGEELINKFNSLIRQEFFIAPLAKIYMQGHIQSLMYATTHVEEETNRPVIILMMDRLTEGEEF